MTESRSFGKEEKSEEHKDFSSRMSEDHILPFEFPFNRSHELHSYLVGAVTQILVSTLDRILLKILAPGLIVVLLKFHSVTGVPGFWQINSGLQIY